MTIAERFQGANMIDAGRLSPYWGEHAARYVFARPFVTNKRVLDIACGTGYGLSLLKSVAKHITGVDIDLEAVLQARSECDESAAVIVGNGLQLPFDDNCIDVVTSFETLEHLYERTGFLAELKRVLRPDGRLVLSTPNANYTKPVNGKPTNPFHVFEYSPEELRGELETHFRIDQFMGQTLDPSIRIPPFEDAQKRLPGDLATQLNLFGWKVFNKIPQKARETLSEAIWHKPFYPMEADYHFSSVKCGSAPVLVAVCTKTGLK